METKCHLPFVRPSQTARSDRLSLGPVPLRGSLNIVVDCYHIYPIPGQKKLTKLSLAFSYHLIVSGCMDRKLKCTVSAVTLLKVVIKMFIIVVSIKQWCELSSAWPGDFTAFHYRLQMSPEWFNATWNHQTLPEKTTNLNCFLGLKKIWHPFQRFFPARVEWKWFMSENLAETTTTLSGDSLNVLRWKPTRIILSIS